MILTGKAKEDFLKYYKKRNKIKLFEFEKVETVFKLQDYLYKNSLIIEWFDSVGIYIEIGKDPVNFLYIVHKGDYKKAHFKCGGFDTRQEATEEAIKKACEIYNKN